MSYQVLARKWRPRHFQQMVGQEHILRMLTNALEQQRLHHAYLFTGTRGVGKTTLARILAKCLNCETGITPTPCGTCKNCTGIDAGRFLDLIEVDAASRTRVEDTRELLDNVHYQPAQGRYKIYLIDEVHMLSGHSFNALLKTLEEPPPYVIFLLATTDPKRLPITVLSRCLQFNLKRVLPEQIANHLQHICTSENISFEAPALQLLAEAADGSLRDALSLLDQTIAFCREKITTADTRQMLGSVDQAHLFRLLIALKEQNGKQLLEEVAHLVEFAVDFNQALEDLLSILHRISVLQVIPDLPAQNEQLQQLAKRFTPEETQLYYQIALIGRRDLTLAPHPVHGFEMILLRMLAFQPKSLGIKASSTATPTIKEKEKVIPTPPQSIPPQDWAKLLGNLGLNGMAYALASNCTLLSMDDSKITLALAVQHEPMLNKKLQDRIEQALIQHLSKTIKLEIIITTQEAETPIKQQREAASAKQLAATEAIHGDSDVQKMLGLFDATVSSITPSS